MKKSHGPAFNKQVIELDQCPVCRGKGFNQGVFHQLACMQCNGSGWVAASGDALSLEDLVTQLGLNLQAAKRHINGLKKLCTTGPEAIYQEGNRLGAGGINFTGD